MESARTRNDSLTLSQRRAVAARGNVLVMAGAGTGKTHTLIQRCLDCLCNEGASLDEILVVTFTEAAATEMKQRLRAALEKNLNSQPSTLNHFCAEQLALFDTAHIGTLHSFCLKLVREHFYELGLDPQLIVLDEGETRLLAEETLDGQFQSHYAGQAGLSAAAQNLIQIYGNGDERPIRAILLRLHHYIQTRPDADRWLAEQITRFASPEPVEWREWLPGAIRNWRDEWLPVLENLGTPASGTARSKRDELRAVPEAGAPSNNEKAAECLEILRKLPKDSSREQAAQILKQLSAAGEIWPKGRKMKLEPPLKPFFTGVEFLLSVAAMTHDKDPLAEDWDWIRGHMTTLLQLAREFGEKFAERKRADGILDFHDLEQFALKLLCDSAAGKPTSAAEHWRKKIRFVFVDEYQDINAAQDRIIQALSREVAAANRFLVGDVKQSIYRFRLADPKIFRDYAKTWRDSNGQTIPLAENFRSRESLLGFVNSIFELLMREEVGGVGYDAEARLRFGAPEHRAALSLAKNPSPRVELLLRFKSGRNDGPADGESGGDDLAELEETGKEARLIARRLRELIAQGHKIRDEAKDTERAVEWRDVAVLLRAPSNKAEAYAKEFERAGAPLVVERGGFYDSAEILDLLGLLQLLDNPLQDVPAIAVLRSPLAGLSPDELATVRLAARDTHFWTALNRIQNSEFKIQKELLQKVEIFLDRYRRWRQLARQASLSRCLEDVLAETHYAEWLLSRPRGAQRRANIERFLGLVQKFDQFQRQGLFRFLKFVEAQQAAEAEPDVAAVAGENAVRLMSIHQSKGLEFPVVVVADLAKPFNEQDLRGEIIFDEEFGLCPRVKPPRHRMSGHYPSLPHWLAQQRQRREQWGEELRLLYVAMTRARDTLILTATVTQKKWETLWTKPDAITTQAIVTAKSYADWFALWFAQQANGLSPQQTEGEFPHLRWRFTEDEELANRRDESTGSRGRSPHRLKTLDRATAEKLRAVLIWKYPFAAATRRAAKSSVTALRRQAGELDDEAEQVFRLQFSAKRLARTLAPPARNPQSAIRNPQLNAADAGTAHHKFLQHVSLEKAGDGAALEAEAKRLEREKVLSTDERAVLGLEDVAAFWSSDVGRKIRGQAAHVRRELAFTVKFSPKELAEITGIKSEPELGSEFVVVQGVADLVVLLPKEIWLADFKTDEVHANELPEKIRLYAPQLKLYARALAKIYSRPVTNRWLHFLSARRTVEI
ncbi:MAG: helicase-exonuclease AddAB subunit AddA [Verrucomicrobiota bacterium]|jgi:ATP-dependent helicase/nuclease subunit A